MGVSPSGSSLRSPPGSQLQPRIIFWNLHSFNNIADIVSVMRKENILAVSETWSTNPSLKFQSLSSFVSIVVPAQKRFDWSCKKAKRQLSTALRLAKRNNFTQNFKEIFLNKKREFRDLLISKEKNYNNKLINNFNDCKNSFLFRQAVRSVRGGLPMNGSNINLKAWHKFLIESFPPPIVNPVSRPLFRLSHPVLDGDIPTDEILISLARCKNGKALGIDEIGYEFYRNLSQNWIFIIQHLFNSILGSESVPADWGKIATFMIFKQRKTNDPSNYSLISLVNSMAPK